MSALLLDDHLLLGVLLNDEPTSLRPAGAALATTGLWYHRLCRALADDAVIGPMSRRLGGVDDTVAADVLGAVVDLPDTIELMSLRTLGWPMGSPRRRGSISISYRLRRSPAAHHLSADICLAQADENAPLRAAAKHSGVTIRTIRD